MTVCGGWMLSASCTRDNPAFSDTEDPPTTTMGSIDGGNTDGPTGASATGVSTTGAPATDASATGIDVTSLGTGGPTSDVDTTPGDTTEPTTGTTGEPIDCSLHDPDPIEIHVHAHALDGDIEIFPPVCNDIIATPNGPLTIMDGNIQHTACGACKCIDELGTELRFADTLSPPMLPECGRLVIWAGPAPDGGGACRWEGFAVLEAAADSVPYFLGTNGRLLPPSIFGGVSVELDDIDPCIDGTSCDYGPGRHGLVFDGDMPVQVGIPSDATIGFVEPTLFHVTNRMSSVDVQCLEHVAWEALADP